MAEQSNESFDSNWLGECDICLEDVSEKKLLACGHDFCLNCLNLLCAKPGSSFFNAHLSILICPSCSQETRISRASLSSLPSQYFGRLKCCFCHVGKPVDEMWWCLSCVKIICSKCDVKSHRKYQHKVSEWSSLKGIKDCCRLLLQDFNLESQLNKFFSKVTKEIVKKVSYSSERLHLADKLCHAYGLEITDDVDQLDLFPYHEREDVTAEVITAVKEALSLANFPKTVANELEKALKRSEKNETTFKLGNILPLKVAEMVITEARKLHQVPAPTHPKNKTGRCSSEVAGIKVKETSRLQQTVPSLSQKVSATRVNNSGKLKASPALAAAAADGNGWWPSEFPILSPVPNSRNEPTSSRPQAEMMSEETIQPLTIKKTCTLNEFSHYSKRDTIHSHNRSTYSQVVSHGRQQEHPLAGAITPDLETFSLNTKKLAEVRLHEQKQVLGEQLFPLIHQLYPDLAGKLTGMLLEMDNSELVMMLEEPNLLRTNVEGAVKVLLKSLLWDVSGEREWVVQNSVSPDQEPEVMISTTPSAQALRHEEKQTGIGRENNVSIDYTDGMG